MTISPIRPKWKGTLTDRERFNRQMHYQPVDRCFNMEFGYWEENFHEWPIFYKNGITNNDEADQFFNFDRTASISGNVWMEPAFEKRVIEVRETTRVLINEDGLLAEVAPRQSRYHPALHQILHRHPGGLGEGEGRTLSSG